MPTRRPLARPGMPQIKTYTACFSAPQLDQRSTWFGGFWQKHRLREKDTDNRRGQPFARNSTGVRGRSFGGGTPGCQARGCALAKTSITFCTIWIAAGTVSTSAIHRKAPRIDNTRTSSSKVEERLRPCRLPPYDGGYLRGQLAQFRVIIRHRGTRRHNAGGGPGPH